MFGCICVTIEEIEAYGVTFGMSDSWATVQRVATKTAEEQAAEFATLYGFASELCERSTKRSTAQVDVKVVEPNMPCERPTAQLLRAVCAEPKTPEEQPAIFTELFGEDVGASQLWGKAPQSCGENLLQV